MLTWVIDAAPHGRTSAEDIALCMLNVNFTALHTTAMVSATCVLAYPALSSIFSDFHPCLVSPRFQDGVYRHIAV